MAQVKHKKMIIEIVWTLAKIRDNSAFGPIYTNARKILDALLRVTHPHMLFPFISRYRERLNIQTTRPCRAYTNAFVAVRSVKGK